MKIVIEMNDEQYYEVCRGDSSAVLVPKGDLINVIRNGTPLPKGHGRLIDADRLKIDNPLHLSLDIPYVTEDTVEDIIDYAPTIIGADGGREDEVGHD